MIKITANIPERYKSQLKKFIEELGGEIISETKPSKKQAVLRELEDAFSEAKDIRAGKKQGLTVEELLGSDS